MSKKAIVGLTLVAIVCALAIPVLSTHYSAKHQDASLRHAKEAGIALKLYADDHHGMLPANFDELIPKYISDPKFFEHMTLLTPSAKLEELPPRSVVIQYSPPERKDALIRVRSDMSGEIIHNEA